VTIKPSSAKWRQPQPEKHYTGKGLRPFNKYRHAKSIDDYFYQRIIKQEDSECWGFANAGDKNGYPQTTGSKHCKQLGLTRAHQVAWYVHNGRIPEDKIVCHTCDNPWCVNPDHLFLGTWNDNVQDMVAKGRYIHPKVYGHHSYKITKAMAEEIKALHKKKTCFEVAEIYGLSFSVVCRVWRGETLGY
jgi:hypothetical protein